MPSKRKTQSRAARAAKKARKQSSMDKPSGESRYGRKRRYLVVNGGWGFEYPEPKPWRG